LAFSFDDTYPLEGSEVRVVKRDFDKCMEMAFGKLMREEPWQKMPDPKPDLSWHEPTCTLEDWKHTDVKCELGGGIVYFTLNRPDTSNKLTGSVLAALIDAVFLLHKRRDLRVAVITGVGALFSAGGEPRGDGGGAFDTEAVPAEVQAAREVLGQRALKRGAFPDGKLDMGRILQTRLWHALAMVPQFTICLANGSAMGDGMGLVTCCDYAVSVEGAFFSLADVKLGLVPAGVAPYIVAKTGNGVAKRIFCTSENMTAEKAVDAGIIDEVVADVAAAHKHIAQFCEKLSLCGPRTVEAAKELVLGVTGQQIIEPLMFYTSMMSAKIGSSAEASAATAAMQSGKPKPWEVDAIKPKY